MRLTKPVRIVRNYVPNNRRWMVIRRHAPIIIKPLVVAMVPALLWRLVLHPNDIVISEPAREPIMLGVLPLLGLMYVLFASVAVTSVINRFTALSASVVTKNKDRFLVNRDEQLPIMMHILVGAPSVLIVMFLMLLDYGTSDWGMTAVFAVTYVVALVWLIAIELDDFNNSIWFQDRVPAEWYTIDIQEYFWGTDPPDSDDPLTPTAS